MIQHSRFGFLFWACALILALAVCSPLMAMGGYTSDQISKGQIQKIDYQHHSITVNGETYAVSPTARYNGVGGFSVLSIGMPIQYILGGVVSNEGPGTTPSNPMGQQADSPSLTIVAITWLPGGVR